MSDEPEFTQTELQALTQEQFMALVAQYIEIGIDWNFERAEVTNDGKWVSGRDLRDEIHRRIVASATGKYAPK